ncbi:MAG: PDZ domain-containing protein [Phycisphaerae bacterium]|nr:PDZ domain-containing protein [Phycisphaerae bacterium]
MAVASWLSLAIGTTGVMAADAALPALLARSVPADARLYLEFHALNSFVGTPFDLMMTRMAGDLMASGHSLASQPPGTQPATQPAGWRAWFAETMGLKDPRAADLLFSGPIAFAAEGWSGLGDAVLLAEPKDVGAFEAVMAPQREPSSQKVRVYKLSQEHELACDGRVAVLGRAGAAINLYQRTVALWESDAGATLGDIAEFRERMAGLPAGAQIIFYAGSTARAAEARFILGQWWPADWVQLRAVAIGVGVSPAGLMFDVDGRAEPDPELISVPPLATDALSRLPASVVAAWTQPIDFVERFRRLQVDDPTGIIEVLLADMPGRSVEWQLLDHLGDSAVFVLAGRPMSAGTASNPQPGMVTATAPGATTMPATAPTATGPAVAASQGSVTQPATASSAPSASPEVAPASATGGPSAHDPALILPVLAMLVETDDPHAVEAALERITVNLQYLVASRSPGDASGVVRRIPERGGGQMVSVSLRRLFESHTKCPFLLNLELSWMIWDRWLIIGTSADVVREIVAARRGEGELLPRGLMPHLAAEVGKAGTVGQMLLLGQPHDLAEMLDSWVAYVSAYHPQMLRPEWWRDLERRQRSMGVQLGVVPTAQAVRSGVEVGQTLPGYPAFGVLQPGDLILRVDGHPLSTNEPARTLRHLLSVAGESGKVTLGILRAGREQDVTITMPIARESAQAVQPIALLRQIAGFLRPFPAAGYAVWRPGPERLKAHLELRFTSSTQPPR